MGRGGVRRWRFGIYSVLLYADWLNLFDWQVEDALYEIESKRRFSGLAKVTDVSSDETTILNLLHLLERHELIVILLEVINTHLKAQRFLVSKSTMLDATFIHAPSLTKNQEQGRDFEMLQMKKGKQWYFGIKVYVGADVE
jgi:IS5 family transposase